MGRVIVVTTHDAARKLEESITVILHLSFVSERPLVNGLIVYVSAYRNLIMDIATHVSVTRFGHQYSSNVLARMYWWRAASNLSLVSLDRVHGNVKY